MATPRGRRAIIGSSASIIAVIAAAVFLSMGVASSGRGALPDPSAAALPSAATVVTLAPATPAAAASLDGGGATASGDPAPVAASAAPASAAPTSDPPPSATPSATPVARPPNVAPGDNPALVARLQAALDSWRKKTGVPGVSATVTFPDGSSWNGSSGLANIATKRPVTTETAFAVASVSKTFLSAVTMQLVASGDLALDRSARAYLPSLPIDRRITIRMLLDHTSGLQDFFATPKIDKLLQGARGQRWDAEMALRYMDLPYFKPGKGWHYSNTNYLVLGLLVEQVTGESLGTVFRDRLFSPLGLTHTWYQPTEPPIRPVAHAYQLTGTPAKTRAKDLSDGSPVTPFTSVVTAAGGAGAIASTSADLAAWARALYGGHTVLGEKVMRAMIDDASRTAKFRPYVPYGLGVQVLSIDGHPSLGHSGRLLGSRSDVRFVTDAGIAVAVLTNQSRDDPRVLSRTLLKIVLPPRVSGIPGGSGAPSHQPTPTPRP